MGRLAHRQGFTAHALAKLLKRYDIKPASTGPTAATSAAIFLTDFVDSVVRSYLSPEVFRTVATVRRSPSADAGSNTPTLLTLFRTGPGRARRDDDRARSNCSSTRSAPPRHPCSVSRRCAPIRPPTRQNWSARSRTCAGAAARCSTRSPGPAASIGLANSPARASSSVSSLEPEWARRHPTIVGNALALPFPRDVRLRLYVSDLREPDGRPGPRPSVAATYARDSDGSPRRARPAISIGARRTGTSTHARRGRARARARAAGSS